MSEHYYSNKPSVDHQRRTIEETLRGKKLRFVTDAGVFSKGGVDYGSKVLIDLMEIPEKAKVLDVGCGYGPIGFSAALLAPQGHVTMVDVNERAVELAKENASANGIHNVTIEQSDLFERVVGKSFDVILTNPPIRAGKETVHRIFTEAYDHLNADGSLWIVIQKKQGAPSARAKLEELFGEDNVEEIGKDKGYRILKSIKRKS
ncbi:16S rRNA methyltransferase [Paenibacillus selenitireducens]|uniref:16S rRNA methyltransferase n=1 Tax=Paenibacillus selenitireducens TaxID=1324314 RepID=A0A1T2WZY2_9BACL|nr:class I SAM-dependent methyltransferase [Paenibacillus selenitireducens]OPA73125.1 16S rRNA methyltransferase [Paenibacillus selenitireducens]